MADKIIVVKEKKRGCGCAALLIFLFVGAMIFYFVNEYHELDKEVPRSQRVETPRDPTEPPSKAELDMMISKIVRKELNDPDSYSAIGTRVARHPNGYLFIHEFRARNQFNALVKNELGLLYETNTSSWVYCDYSQLSEWLSQIIIDPKLKDAIK